jgi:hypothetical protein
MTAEDEGSSHSRIAIMSSAMTPRTTFLDSNVYVSHHYLYPFLDLDGYVTRSITTWRTEMSCDTNSTFDNSTLGAGEEEVIFYNDTKVNKTVDLSGETYEDLDGNTVSSLVLSPFTSKILIIK